MPATSRHAATRRVSVCSPPTAGKIVSSETAKPCWASRRQPTCCQRLTIRSRRSFSLARLAAACWCANPVARGSPCANPTRRPPMPKSPVWPPVRMVSFGRQFMVQVRRRLRCMHARLKARGAVSLSAILWRGNRFPSSWTITIMLGCPWQRAESGFLMPQAIAANC